MGREVVLGDAGDGSLWGCELCCEVGSAHHPAGTAPVPMLWAGDPACHHGSPNAAAFFRAPGKAWPESELNPGHLSGLAHEWRGWEVHARVLELSRTTAAPRWHRRDHQEVLEKRDWAL